MCSPAAMQPMPQGKAVLMNSAPGYSPGYQDTAPRVFDPPPQPSRMPLVYDAPPQPSRMPLMYDAPPQPSRMPLQGF